MEKEIQRQNEILKGLLVMVIEMLPKHTKECGVYSAHPSYGDTYCNCNMGVLKKI